MGGPRAMLCNFEQIGKPARGGDDGAKARQRVPDGDFIRSGLPGDGVAGDPAWLRAR
jgi:hypothetical protein